MKNKQLTKPPANKTIELHKYSVVYFDSDPKIRKFHKTANRFMKAILNINR